MLLERLSELLAAGDAEAEDMLDALRPCSLAARMLNASPRRSPRSKMSNLQPPCRFVRNCCVRWRVTNTLPEERQRILVVDDERVNRTLPAELPKNEHQVLLTQSGVQALERVTADPDDLILLDVICRRWTATRCSEG